jgi:drug/metabolite transporter (DMT)-like permease
VALARFGIGGLAVCGLVKLLGQSIWGSNRRLLLIRGVIGTIAAICQFQGILTLPIAAAMVLFFTFPIFSAILSPWINREPTSAGDWLFIIMAIFGTVLILWPENSEMGFNYRYLYPLTGAFCAGLVTNLLRRLRASNTPMTLYFYLCLVGFLVCLGPTLAQESPFIPKLETFLGLTVVAVLASIAQLAMNQGFKFVSAPRGGVLMMSEVILGSLAGIIFFGEPLGFKFIAGALLIIISGVFLTLRPPHPVKTTEKAA